MNPDSFSSRPTKRSKMNSNRDLTWHDLPAEIKEKIVLAAPKELWPLFRLVCWEWTCLIHPHFLKPPSQRDLGKYYKILAQHSVIRWALREKNVDLFEWLIVNQGMKPVHLIPKHAEADLWITFAVKHRRCGLVRHLMSSCGVSMCSGALLYAIRSGDMNLLKLVIGSGDNLPSIKSLCSELNYSVEMKMIHAPFYSMNEAMIRFAHPAICRYTFDCLEGRIKAIIKRNPKGGAACEIVDSLLSQKKYKNKDYRYGLAAQCFAYSGHLEPMKFMISKYKGEIKYMTRSLWAYSTYGGHLNILNWVNHKYAWDKRSLDDSKKTIKKFIRKRDYKVLKWFLDHNLLGLGQKHLKWAIEVLSDDPELIPMLSWIIRRIPEPEKINMQKKFKLIGKAIQTLRSDLIHWFHNNNELLRLDPVPQLPVFAGQIYIGKALHDSCYHFLRTLHDLKICDFCCLEILHTGQLFLNYWRPCRCAPELQFKKHRNHKSFFLASDLGL